MVALVYREVHWSSQGHKYHAFPMQNVTATASFPFLFNITAVALMFKVVSLHQHLEKFVISNVLVRSVFFETHAPLAEFFWRDG